MSAITDDASKRIYWEKGYGRAFMIICHYVKSIANLRRMFKEVKKSFPKLTEADVEAGRIIRSLSEEGGAVISFTVPGKKRKIEGWMNCNGRPEFNIM